MPDANVREMIERIEAGLAQHENDCTCSAVIPNDAHCTLTELGITLTDLLSILALAKRADEAERKVTLAVGEINHFLKLSNEDSSYSINDNTAVGMRDLLAALNAKEPAPESNIGALAGRLADRAAQIAEPNSAQVKFLTAMREIADEHHECGYPWLEHICPDTFDSVLETLQRQRENPTPPPPKCTHSERPEGKPLCRVCWDEYRPVFEAWSEKMKQLRQSPERIPATRED